MIETAEVAASLQIPRNRPDQDLVAAARSGDMNALGELVSKQKKRVCRVAYSITRNHEDAEDVAQAVFLKVLAGLQGFEGRSSFLTWLTRIAVNESLALVRRRTVATVSLDETADGGDRSEVIEAPDARPTPEQSCSFAETQSFLASALKRLHPNLRVVFVMHLEGYSGKETAEVLGSSVASVKTRLFRARAALRTQFNRFLHSVAENGETSRGALIRSCS